MEKEDLFTHSPVRYFDKATSAGLKDGQLGLITSKKGLGKTSILVQFGLDNLLNNKALVHVSFDQKSSNVISWYSSILSEIAKMAEDAGLLWDAAQMSQALAEREEMESTALENGVAILHPRRPTPNLIAQDFLAVAISRSGVPFGLFRRLPAFF